MIHKYFKYALFLLLLIFVFLSGAYFTYQYLIKPHVTVEEEADVLLEKVKTVAKLVTVEGYFSEIYTYKNDWEPMPNPIFSPTFTKQAITIVKAKVSVGYDIEKMNFEIDHSQKILKINNIPAPEIISLEHDIEYYDIQESTFNTFTKEEMNHLSANAKTFIKNKALESELFKQAETQGGQMVDVIEMMVKESGWKVEYIYKMQDATVNPFY